MISEILLLLYVFLFLSPPVDGGMQVLLDQPHDFRTDKEVVLSFDAPGSDAEATDDFRPTESVIIESITFWMPATSDPPPYSWMFNVYRTTDNHQIYPYAPEFLPFFTMLVPSSVVDLGFWATQTDRNGNEYTFNLYEVRFDNVGLRLDPGGWIDGMFWLSSQGRIRRGPELPAWGTANNGVKNGSEALWRLTPNTWVRLSDRGTEPSDYAMRIEGYRVADAPEPETVVTSFEIVTGDLLDGDVDDIRRTDDQRVTVRSSFRDINQHRMEMIVHAQTKTENADLMDITIEQRVSDHARGLMHVLLFNWRTGDYDEIALYTVSHTEFVYAIRDIPSDDYVNEDGEIQLMIDQRNLANSLFGWTFEYYLNRVRFDLRIED